MKRIKLCCFTMMFLASSSYAYGFNKTDTLNKVPQSVCGNWVVQKVITFSAVPDYEYIRSHVKYSTKIMRFGDKLIIRNPVYVSDKWSSEKFSEGFRDFVLSDIGIKENSVRVVEVFKNKKEAKDQDYAGPGTTVFVRSKDQIIVNWDGAFYLLQREGKACSGRPSVDLHRNMSQ